MIRHNRLLESRASILTFEPGFGFSTWHGSDVTEVRRGHVVPAWRNASPGSILYTTPMLDLEGDRLRLGFPDGWIDHHPQTRLELEQEAERLLPADVRLEFE